MKQPESIRIGQPQFSIDIAGESIRIGTYKYVDETDRRLLIAIYRSFSCVILKMLIKSGMSVAQASDVIKLTAQMAGHMAADGLDKYIVTKEINHDKIRTM